MNVETCIRSLFLAVFIASMLPSTTIATAAPDDPVPVLLTVNTAVDMIFNDRKLSLREALGIANGTYTLDFDEGERQQMAGCVFAGNNIIGGCGAGIVDNIVFDPSLGNSPVITIYPNSPLPPINDTAPTNILGHIDGVYPIINAASAGMNENGLTITSNHNSIYGLTIINAPRDGFHITSNGNIIGSGSGARSNTRHGIMIDGGDDNIIDAAFIGVTDSPPYACAGNGVSGITLINGATNNTIRDTIVGCGNTGISISGSSNNQIGPNVYIGIAPDGTPISNTNYGVRVSGGAQWNTVITSTVSHNKVGVAIQGSGSNNNTVRASVVRNNTQFGIEVSGGVSFTSIGGTQGGSYAQGNLISANAVGILISDTLTSHTYVYGNRVGTNSDGSAADGNAIAGIYIVWANTNFIGATSAERNLISGNGYGVWIKGAIINQVQGNAIGVNISGTESVANGDGVFLSNGAQANTIGGDSIENLNIIAGNTNDGVRIEGSATATNTVALNDIGLNTIPLPYVTTTRKRVIATAIAIPNQHNGVSLQANTHNNIIGPGNTVANNGHSGVSASGGAHHNTIDNNSVYSNTQQGVELIGANTSFNIITRTASYQNGMNGIAESGGAVNNDWREMSIYNNGGLGINRGSEYPLAERPDPPTNFRIISVDPTTGLVGGQADSSTDQLHTIVDLYRLALDPSSYGEGQAFIGSGETDDIGNWTILDPMPALSGGCYTAVVRSIANDVTFASEFTRSNCSVYMPQVQR